MTAPILLQLGTTWGGGVERVIETLSHALRAEGVTTQIVYPQRAGFEEAASGLRDQDLDAVTDSGMYVGHEARTLMVTAQYFRMLVDDG